jgi:hypothetical protein
MDISDAALRQLAGHGERLALLEQRESDHFRQIGERLGELGSLVADLGETVRDQAAILAALQAQGEQVAALAARLDAIAPTGDEGEGDARAYVPSPATRWWKLRGAERDAAAERLRGWVEQVYRPGYGQLAATLGPCWASHPLCLYVLDIACELWSVLYLQPKRTGGTVSAQAEYQARILPALAEQMMIETQRCGHAPHRRGTLNGAVTGRRP